MNTTLKQEVLAKYVSPYFFETGTSSGAAVYKALDAGFEKIFSVEIDSVLYEQNLVRFEKEIREGRVHLFLGDTFVLMPMILQQFIDKQCTFWLDAHQDFGPGGIKKCPLLDELEHIKVKGDLKHKLMIDDRRCFGNDWWGAGISEELVVAKIKEINPDYVIGYEDGEIKNDIITAVI